MKTYKTIGTHKRTVVWVLDNNIDYDSDQSDEKIYDSNQFINDIKIKNPFFNRNELIINERLQKINDADTKDLFATFNNIFILLSTYVYKIIVIHYNIPI